MQTANLNVRDAMVPRSKMISISSDASFEGFLSIITNSSHSRFPITDSNNKVIGIFLAKDLLNFMASDNDNFHYLDHLRQVITIPENKSLDSLLKFFQLKRSHMMIVIDEYFAVSGLITLEDVLEQIVGEIEDEHDFEEDDIIDYEKNRFLVKSNISIDDFNKYFSSNLSATGVDTIAGLIGQKFGYLPKQLEEINLGNLNFKILKADSRKIQLIEVIKKD